MPWCTTSSALSHMKPGSRFILSRVPVTSWNSDMVNPGQSAVT